MSLLLVVMLFKATVIATESAPPETARSIFVSVSKSLCVAANWAILFSS